MEYKKIDDNTIAEITTKETRYTISEIKGNIKIAQELIQKYTQEKSDWQIKLDEAIKIGIKIT